MANGLAPYGYPNKTSVKFHFIVRLLAIIIVTLAELFVSYMNKCDNKLEEERRDNISCIHEHTMR